MAKWKKVTPEEKEKLAARLRAALSRKRGVAEKRMFGGVCFLLGGNMLCGTGSGDFMFRVGKEEHADAVKRPGARPVVMNGRRMEGFVWVKPEKCDARKLASWTSLAASYVSTLPAKKKR